MHRIPNKFSDLDNSTGVALPQSKLSDNVSGIFGYLVVNRAYGIRECRASLQTRSRS
jgi:hypothetical protein